jgi:glycosyltransferase involved in cell wall biosynthesis
MKIAFIGQKGIPAKSGGIEKHVEELAIRMAAKGHKVFVYVRDNYTDKKLIEYKGVKLIHLPSISTKHLDAISHTFFAAAHSIFGGYDVIHFHGIGPSFLSWIPKVFSRKAKVVATFHCQDYYHQKWSYFAKSALKMGEYIACKVPDKTITVSKTLQKYAQDKYGVKTEMISNGANVVPTEKNNLLAKWNLKPKKYIIYPGRLIKHKGVHYLIEAFKQLEDSAKVSNGFKLVIVGDGFHTDDYVEYLQTISAGRESIVFTGSQSGETLAQLFANAYTFVLPSETEGLSLALLEAMGYGLGVLVSDIIENVDPLCGNGFVFKNKSVIDLRDKLAYMINRPDEISKMGERAKKHVEENYSWDSITNTSLKLYTDLISKK